MIPNFVPETEAGLAEGVKNGKKVTHWIRRHTLSIYWHEVSVDYYRALSH